jgi:hypothetical protein
VDYQRAVDSLSRAWVWDEIMVRGFPKKLINIIREGYEDFWTAWSEFLATDTEVPGSIPGATRFSE